GNAMREAVEYSQADIVVFIDGDGTYSISHLRSVLEPLLKGEADMVVGSRLLGNREEGSISTLNMMGNKLFNKVINIALKSHVTDSLTGYRALRRNVFKDLILFSENFEIEVEMTVEALAKGYRIVEVPINYRKRTNSKTRNTF
ncbi:MAG: glycosyltransferase, partial [Nitrosopumilaceae archaeon]